MVKEDKDVSKVITTCVNDMYQLFLNHDFNQDIDISSWDVSNVKNMQHMFWGARDFNQDISSWDVSKVTNMTGMFREASAFNQDISSWDVSNVEMMASMFRDATSFNQDLSSWTVEQVKNCRQFSLRASRWTKNKPQFKEECK